MAIEQGVLDLEAIPPRIVGSLAYEKGPADSCVVVRGGGPGLQQAIDGAVVMGNKRVIDVVTIKDINTRGGLRRRTAGHEHGAGR